ncbi:hypothetical protein N177_0376 [Lutibaculum baratangense AMV1]|uniref:Uncharacterized protein n=1 Tax=Lutibaculum baratangense AMV1 TaxID=631454 RepID=V4RV88_9HYPH|nr:hypothetical protein N177_0376 [Lutibaculum baratangense AMV1]
MGGAHQVLDRIESVSGRVATGCRARLQRNLHRRPRGGVIRRVDAETAADDVGAGTPEQRVVAVPADERVVAAEAPKQVIPGIAFEPLGVGRTRDRIRRLRAEHDLDAGDRVRAAEARGEVPRLRRQVDVGAAARHVTEVERVDARPAVDPVAKLALEHIDRVVAGAAIDRVRGKASVKVVVAVSAVERVAAAAAQERVVARATIDDVGAARAGDGVVAGAGDHVLEVRVELAGVVRGARRQVEHVVAAPAGRVERVDAGAAVHRLRTDLGDHRVVAAIAVIGVAVAVGDDRVAARAVEIDLDAGERRCAGGEGRDDLAGLEVEYVTGACDVRVVERVRAGAAVDIVEELAVEHDDQVVAGFPVDRVGAEAAEKRVIPTATVERVNAASSFQAVRATAGLQEVVGGGADHRLVAGGGGVVIVLEVDPGFREARIVRVSAGSQVEGYGAEGRAAAIDRVDVAAAVGEAGARDAGARRSPEDPVVAGAAEHRVGAQASAIDRVVARATLQPVRRLVAVEVIVARAARRVLDERGRVAAEEQRVEDVAARVVAVSEIGELRRGEGRVLARAQVDVEVGRVVGEVVGVDAAAVPDRLEDAVAARRDRQHAVDVGLARRRVPGVDGVAAVDAVVGAVHVLQRRDVEHHEGLRRTPRLICVARRRTAHIGAVGHDRIFERVVSGRKSPIDARLVAVLQAERVAELVQHGVPVIVACIREVAARPEEGVAARDGVAGIVGVGRAGVARVRHTDRAGAGTGACIGDREVREPFRGKAGGTGRLSIDGVVQAEMHGHHLLGTHLAEARERPGRVSRLIVGGRIGIAVGDRPGPSHAAQEAVDPLIACCGHGGGGGTGAVLVTLGKAFPKTAGGIAGIDRRRPAILIVQRPDEDVGRVGRTVHRCPGSTVPLRRVRLDRHVAPARGRAARALGAMLGNDKAPSAVRGTLGGGHAAGGFRSGSLLGFVGGTRRLRLHHHVPRCRRVGRGIVRAGFFALILLGRRQGKVQRPALFRAHAGGGRLAGDLSHQGAQKKQARNHAALVCLLLVSTQTEIVQAREITKLFHFFSPSAEKMKVSMRLRLT